MLTYPHESTSGFTFSIDGKVYSHLHSEVAFVALRNVEHDGVGYFVETGTQRATELEFPLVELP